MPAGTPSHSAAARLRKLARDQFGSTYRHALVLHTDEPHPHVHVVVKAVGEHGNRLNIRKATLRDWRHDFAANLRELGVAANATERAVRGNSKSPMPRTASIVRISVETLCVRSVARICADIPTLRRSRQRRHCFIPELK